MMCVIMMWYMGCLPLYWNVLNDYEINVPRAYPDTLIERKDKNARQTDQSVWQLHLFINRLSVSSID